MDLNDSNVDSNDSNVDSNYSYVDSNVESNDSNVDSNVDSNDSNLDLNDSNVDSNVDLNDSNAPNEDSNQPVHMQNLISPPCQHEKTTLHPWISKIPLVQILIKLQEYTGLSESLLVAHVKVHF